MGERVEINDISEALSYVNDLSLNKIFEIYKKSLDKEIFFKGVFISKEEVFLEVQSRITDQLKERYRELKSKISKLRKKGFDVNNFDYELLKVPLKMKLLNAEFIPENYNLILEILNESEKNLSEFKIE